MSHHYAYLLSRWIPSTRRHLRPFPGNGGLLSYGPGNHGHWSQQTNNTALTAFAELAVNPHASAGAAKMSRDEMTDTALKLLRFTLQGHHAGGGCCVDGETWGHSWISALCIERMAHAIETLEPHFTDQDKQQLRNVLVSEADWLLDNYTITAGLVNNNKPESNMWNGALLWRTASMYPDLPRAKEYKEKAIRFFANAISFPKDATSVKNIDGIPLKNLHEGANFFETCACNHHGYLNIGYINITLSNLGMLHFSGKYNNWELPKALYLHAKDVWPFTKTCVFPDGRLLRIGGDTRVRYCYCQDYAIQTWLLFNDLLEDKDTRQFEKGWLKIVKKEQESNKDGSFLGNRLRSLEAVSPLYYTRLEGDKAASLSMAAAWHRRFPELHDKSKGHGTPLLQDWEDEYHGACLTRSENRIAVWTWLAAEKPMGLTIPTNQSSMAEWKLNSAGQILGMGALAENINTVATRTTFPGGFVTSGSFITKSILPMAEGESEDQIAKTCIAFAALPDDATTLVIQVAHALNRFFFRAVKGLAIPIPNDVFNGYNRTFTAQKIKTQTLVAPPKKHETIDCGIWLNIDGAIAIRALNTKLILNRPKKPQITIKSSRNQPAYLAGGLLYAEEICAHTCIENEFPVTFDPNETLFDLAVAIRTNATVHDTRNWIEQPLPKKPKADKPKDLRFATIRGQDDIDYALVFNIGSEPIQVKAFKQHLELKPMEAKLIASQLKTKGTSQ